jgi:hypothetical protein
VKKSEKRPVSPFAGYVCTTPKTVAYDETMLPCRVDLSIDNTHESVPAPAYSNKKSGKSAK